MAFPYNQELLDSAFTYSAYRKFIDDLLSQPPADEAAEKMRPYIEKNVVLMKKYDETYQVSDTLKTALE
ncbi:MAG: hypothetical protein ACRYGB_14980, partial [Janthinobacterium lividum]